MQRRKQLSLKKIMAHLLHDKIAQAERFADQCGAERGHWEQVRRLSMQLFDRLADSLKLDESDRFVLECAAILHDIGWCTGQQGHHKQSMKMILDDTTLPLSRTERVRIGLTARYHRKALPAKDHPIYNELGAEEQKRIDLLAGLLRIADGLDCSHRNLIKGVQAEISRDRLVICCQSDSGAHEEMQAARKKSDLLERVLSVPVQFTQESSAANLY